MVGKCEIYQNKESKEIQGFDEKFLPGAWDLMNVENLPQVTGGRNA